MLRIIMLFSLLFFTPAFADHGDTYSQPISHDDCKRAVKNVIETVCKNYDNCKTTTLADVRPTIMIKLSTLPGNKYASSCINYIDNIYKDYQTHMISNFDDNQFISGPNNKTECEQIYKCIADFGLQEDKVKLELFDIYNKTISSADINNDNLNILKEKSTAMGENMMISALSSCTCTANIKDIKTQNIYRDIMGVSCDETFIENARQSLADYMNNGMWKSPNTKNTVQPYLQALGTACGIKDNN